MSSARAVRLVPLVLLAACAVNPAPSGFLPSPKDAVRDVYGGWIELTVLAGKHDSTVSGELIAVRSDSVWVLPDGGPVRVLATGTVQAARVVRYKSETGAVGGYTALGILSTLSNGAFLLITAPAWLITGLVASNAEAGAPLRRVPGVAWVDLAPNARLPQGLPSGIDLAEIRPKPKEKP